MTALHVSIPQWDAEQAHIDDALTAAMRAINKPDLHSAAYLRAACDVVSKRSRDASDILRADVLLGALDREARAAQLAPPPSEPLWSDWHTVALCISGMILAVCGVIWGAM
jgi:hypothetical protein